MVKHIYVERIEHREDLKIINIYFTFGGWTNRTEEYEYYFEESKVEHVDKILKKHFKYKDIECEGTTCGFGFGNIKYKLRGVSEIIIDDEKKLKKLLQEYIESV